MKALVLLMLAASEPTDPIALERDQPRTRSGIALAAGGFTGMTQSVRVIPSLGLLGEIGMRLNDSLSLLMRTSAVFNLLNVNLGLQGLIDFAFSDRFAFGAGAGMHFFFGNGVTPTLIVMMPLRFSFSPMVRAPTQIERVGFVFGLELTGGVIVFAEQRVGRDFSPLPVPGPWGSVQLTVGWAWW